MAKNFNKENYAMNKYSKSIVYCGSEQDYEITLEQFLKENPNMAEADFEYWKRISDEIYRDEASKNVSVKRNNIAIDDVNERKLPTVNSAEDEYFSMLNSDKLSKENIMNKEFICGLAKKILTDKELKRFNDFYLKKKKMKEIAHDEGVYHTSVSRSITKAKEKIKIRIKDLCSENLIFDIL